MSIQLHVVRLVIRELQQIWKQTLLLEDLEFVHRVVEMIWQLLKWKLELAGCQIVHLAFLTFFWTKSKEEEEPFACIHFNIFKFIIANYVCVLLPFFTTELIV